jgi:hypothetical protein
MTQYLLSVHTIEDEVGHPMTDDEMQQSWKRIQGLEEEMKSVGALVFSGRLIEPDTATVVRMSGGEVLTTDGPFAESKEHLGLLRRLGRNSEAASAYERAAAMAPTDAERDFLRLSGRASR